MVIDLMNLEWWQTLVGILALLGLSPAPWLLGVATGRIQFTAPAQRAFDERVAELKASHEIALAEKDKTHAQLTGELIKHHDELRKGDAERYQEMKLSRDGYRTSTKEQRERADRATETAAQAVEAIDTTNRLLASLNVVAEEATRGTN
jgi:hypothetical protein